MSSNIQWQSFKLTEADRAKNKDQQTLCLWMTGLSGAGKSTLANALEEKLNGSGKDTYILDADNLRHGLNQDLGFCMEVRNANVRLASKGVIDVYPRFGPTMFWDMALGQCIIEEAGRKVLWAENRQPMTYNISHMRNEFIYRDE